ncbi:MAG: hypothetical protein LBL82_03160 [Oscillospiraceae bacterium]|jgi:preprotein translocase subunit SecG|nr:hypothetical protein [Oscillospiraceae bacterium]
MRNNILKKLALFCAVLMIALFVCSFSALAAESVSDTDTTSAVLTKEPRGDDSLLIAPNPNAEEESGEAALSPTDNDGFKEMLSKSMDEKMVTVKKTLTVMGWGMATIFIVVIIIYIVVATLTAVTKEKKKEE